MQAPVAPPRPLISDITIEHGPVDLLGPFFLKADTAARRRDVHLSFAPMQALVDANHRNHETWRPLLPLFDPAVNGAAEEDTFCIVGRNGLDPDSRCSGRGTSRKSPSRSLLRASMRCNSLRMTSSRPPSTSCDHSLSRNEMTKRSLGRSCSQ